MSRRYKIIDYDKTLKILEKSLGIDKDEYTPIFIFKEQLSKEQLVLSYIYGKKKGEFITIDEIKNSIGISKKHLIETLKSLVSDGFIKEDSEKFSAIPNIYDNMQEALEELQSAYLNALNNIKNKGGKK